jgi:hypothetical protein
MEKKVGKEYVSYDPFPDFPSLKQVFLFFCCVTLVHRKEKGI